MTVHATLQGTAALPGKGTSDIVRLPITLPAQDVPLAAGAAKEVTWPVSVPLDAFSIAWEAGAVDNGGAKDAPSDRIKVTQFVAAAVPVRVLQATLAQLDGPFTLPVAAPADALPASGVKRGGINVAVQPRLTGALPGMRRYFETYPFICLEQKTSKSVGLKDAALWAGVRQHAAHLPRQRRPRQLLSAAGRRGAAWQRHAHRLRARGDERSRLRAARCGTRCHARRPGRVRRRPHPAQILVAARRPRREEARGDRGAFALPPGRAAHARLDQHHAQRLADGGGDQLAEHRQARRRHSRSRAQARRGAADPAQPHGLRRHDDEVQHRGKATSGGG